MACSFIKMLNSAEHEIFSIVGIFIFISRETFMLSYALSKKTFAMLVIGDLLAGKISCLAEMHLKFFL